MSKPVRVLVVDDSPLFAEAIEAVLTGDPLITVVGRCEDGVKAVESAARLRPDLITMDLHMPVLGGIEAIERIMSSTPTPILVLTADPEGPGGQLAMEALRRGALEVTGKPSQWVVGPREQEALRRQVKVLSTIPVVYRPSRKRSTPPAAVPFVAETGKLVAIAASTGGPAALARLLSSLPGAYPLPIAIVQHLAPGFARTLATWLDGISELHVATVQKRAELHAGNVYLAPDDAHLIVTEDGCVDVQNTEDEGGHRPSANVLLRSVARQYGPKAVGVVLTGMGDDGAAGLLRMRAAGAVTIAQDEQTSAIWGMPKAAWESGAALHCLSLPDIAAALLRMSGRTLRTGPPSPKGGS